MNAISWHSSPWHSSPGCQAHVGRCMRHQDASDPQLLLQHDCQRLHADINTADQQAYYRHKTSVCLQHCRDSDSGRYQVLSTGQQQVTHRLQQELRPGLELQGWPLPLPAALLLPARASARCCLCTLPCCCTPVLSLMCTVAVCGVGMSSQAGDADAWPSLLLYRRGKGAVQH